MAPMRTAIAVTEENFNKYSTYLSRAGGQWFVQSDFSNKNNEENNKLVLKNTIDLVASLQLCVILMKMKRCTKK